jgi:cyclopropane fatty-acyl-phospholipid synthase-like methyltransferase
MSNENFKNNERNQYHDMSDFYDDAMLAGYYDYKAGAESLANFIKDNSKVLEVGVGTGLFMEQLSKVNPNCDYYGIDHTDSMLIRARKKLNSKIKLSQEDVIDMNLNEKFDVIFSHGGVWGFTEKLFGGHIFNEQKNKQGLTNISQHLKSNGKFFINIQPSHSNSDIVIKDNIIFKQIVNKVNNILYKDYIFEEDGKILSEQRCTYRLFNEKETENLLTECGFKDLGISADGKFKILGLLN